MEDDEASGSLRAIGTRRLPAASHRQIAPHGLAVAGHALRIGAELGIEAAERSRLRVAAVLHDIGKLTISPLILDKPAPLDPREWAQVRSHPALGARMLHEEGLTDIAPWVRAHHERPDGRGYPDGLRGPEIPLESRILAVADAYDAMVSDRPYSPAMTPGDAHEELERGAGAQFDPEIVAAFVSARRDGSFIASGGG